MLIKTQFGRVALVLAAVTACTACGARTVPAHRHAPGPGAGLDTVMTRHALARYRQLGLSLVPNAGQTDRRVRYVGQAAGTSIFFTDRAVTLAFTRRTTGSSSDGLALRLRFLGANPGVRLSAGGRTAGTLNYLAGRPREWRRRLPTYRELTYRDLWPGIDLVFRGQGGTLKYEFHVRRGADPGAIRLAYTGARRLAVGRGGALRIETALGTLDDARPVSYQRRGGRRVPVASHYTLGGGGSDGYGFALGAGYDRGRPLVIDPGLAYSTFLGGSALDEGFGIAVDRAGDAFVTGLTASADYPTSVGPFDPTANGDVDAFVTKLSASGTALVYSTLLGGSGADAGADIAVDGHGSAYVTGSTDSADFPTSSSAFDQTFAGGGPFGGGDAFAAKLDPSGSDLTYATFLGGTGSDEGRGIAVDCAGRAFVVGSTESVDLPATPGAADRTYNGGGDAFVTKFNASGSGLDYSTFLGGTAYDPGFGIAVDDAGSAYVTGATSSADYPLTPGAVDSTPGSSDAFVTKLDASGSALDYSTRLGGSAFDEGLGVAVGADGSAYVTGQTGSADFPTTADAFDAVWDAPSTDAFVTKLNAAGTAAAYSTLLGGTGPEGGQDVAVDAHGNAYVTGQTDSGDYPTTPDALAGALNGAAPDAFVTELDASGAALAYSTLIGGTGLDEGHDIALGPRGRVYITGLTSSADFPTTPAAVDGSPATGSYDAFVTKLETAARGVAEAETCTGRRGGSPTSPRGSRILSARAPCA